MKKILFFVGSINLSGGTERVSSVISNELQRQGYKVHILSLWNGDKPFFELSDGIVVDQIFSTSGRGIKNFHKAIVKLRRYIISHQIDILIDVESMLFLYSFPAALGLNVQHICWEHFNYNVDLGKSSRRLARKLAARFADNVITLTERDRNFWQSSTTCNAKITAIPNPITISAPTKINSNREKLFLAVGRLTYQKGFDLLLQAWSRVIITNPDWRLRIVGDGEDKAMLEQLRCSLNLEASTELVAKTNDISTHYQQASFFIMSSRFEGLPLVLIEAQAYGLPVISFDCNTGPAEIILHGKTGWLCDKLDVDELSILILNAIDMVNDVSPSSHDYEWDKFSKASIDNIKRFELNNVIEKWLAVFHEH